MEKNQWRQTNGEKYMKKNKWKEITGEKCPEKTKGRREINGKT